MNASNARPNLSARNGADPVLTRVGVEGTVYATLARIRMSQEYRNDSDTNVEIVYTFPLPLGSTLLDVTVTLNGKQYRGQVVEKSKAERRYEEAVEAGDTALMVARPEPGLYVMNLGNLMARESVVIDIELATLIDWRGSRARLSLPMTLAPRYGEEASALAPHEKPVHGTGVERGFSMTLGLAGELAQATIASPTHPVATRVDASGARVTLQRESAWMDRDFVLTLEAAAPPAPAFMTLSHGGEAFTYASFQIPSRDHAMAARNVKVVIDCSGSMEGESIWLARAGVAQLLSRLRPQDRFGIVAFGSAAQSYSPCLLEASEWNLEAAQAWVRGLAADMGGTEMRAALDATFSVTGPPGECDVFLITDGQVAETGELVAAVAHAGHRIFVVAVGVAAQQEVLRQLADASGGAMENVSPGEDIADAVRRVFARLVEAPIRALRARAEEGFEWEARTPATIFSGDTVHLFGAAPRMPEALAVEWEAADGTSQQLTLARSASPMADLTPIARIGAALRIQDLARAGEELAATNLAVRHQLVSERTNYILTIDRGAQRAPDLPELRQVEHMVLSASRNFAAALSIGDSIGDLLSLDDDDQPDPDEVQPLPDMPAFAAFLAAAGVAAEKGGLLARTFAELAALGAPQEMIAALRRLMARDGASEEEVVRGFWLVMLSKAAAFGLRPALRQLLDSEKMRLRIDISVAGDILTLFRKTRVAGPVA